MCSFSHQISFTSSARRALMDNATDPFAPVRAPIESLGGTLLSAFFAEDSYDVLALSEFPEGVSTNDVSVAFYSGGAVAHIRSSRLLTASQVYASRHGCNPYALLAVSDSRSRAASA